MDITKAYILVFAALLGLMGCGQKQTDQSARRASGSGVVSEAGQDPVVLTCPDYSVGRIWDPQYMYNGDQLMTSAVQVFVSTHLAPEAMGFVSGNPSSSTGVTFSGGLKLLANGQIDAERSRLLIEISDSLVGQVDPQSGQSIQPYQVQFLKAKSAKVTSGNQMEVVFADAFGEVTLKGQITEEYIYGTVHFKNYQSYNGSSPQQGDLGSFYVYRCGFVY